MSRSEIALAVLVLGWSFIYSSARTFDYFYFVQQWPGSYCDTERGCCYPKTGKPAEDFSIHGLWPERLHGKWPQNCDPDAEFDYSKIADLEEELNKYWGSLSCPSSDGHKFWGHEWKKHGTCSKLDEHSYFQKALALREKVDLLGALKSAGILPDGGKYKVESIKEAIKDKVEVTAKLDCNSDADGNSQLFQVYLCVDKDGSTLFDCPSHQHDDCPSKVKFPPFGGSENDSSVDSEL